MKEERVMAHTAPEINERIRRETQESIKHYTDHPDEIESRLKELQSEWDIERLMEMNASSLVLVSLLLAHSVDKRWLLLTGAVSGFLLLHAVQGWCPPVPILRRLGVRTRDEIMSEMYALKAL